MLTKDWIYLGLIAFTAMTFYVHGYYRGKSSRQNKKVGVPAEIKNLHLPVTGRVLSQRNKILKGTRTPNGIEIIDIVQCFFGNN